MPAEFPVILKIRFVFKGNPKDIEWVPGLSWGKERPERDTDPSPPSSAVVKKE